MNYADVYEITSPLNYRIRNQVPDIKAVLLWGSEGNWEPLFLIATEGAFPYLEARYEYGCG